MYALNAHKPFGRVDGYDFFIVFFCYDLEIYDFPELWLKAAAYTHLT